MPGPDYILDLSTQPAEAAAGSASDAGDTSQNSAPPAENSLRGRPWLAIHWRCCSVYSRIYRDAAGESYHGRCPRCARPLHIAVGEGGTNARFFEAT